MLKKPGTILFNRHGGNNVTSNLPGYAIIPPHLQQWSIHEVPAHNENDDELEGRPTKKPAAQTLRNAEHRRPRSLQNVTKLCNLLAQSLKLEGEANRGFAGSSSRTINVDRKIEKTRCFATDRFKSKT